MFPLLHNLCSRWSKEQHIRQTSRKHRCDRDEHSPFIFWRKRAYEARGNGVCESVGARVGEEDHDGKSCRYAEVDGEDLLL